jgi:hypothetical protein
VVQSEQVHAAPALSQTGLIGEIPISNVLKNKHTVRKAADFSKINQVV